MGNRMVTRSEESITLNDVLPAFLTTVTDPSHSFRMTLNALLIMTPYHGCYFIGRPESG